MFERHAILAGADVLSFNVVFVRTEPSKKKSSIYQIIHALPAFPHSYCVDAHAGLEADLISWDMTLMVASNECGKAAAGIELFLRSATVLPKRPVVLLMDATPNQVRLVLLFVRSSAPANLQSSP